MRKGGYYVNNTLLGEVDKGTGRRVNKLIVNKLIAKKDRVTREVDKETSGRVNKLIAKKDRVTRGRVDKWTGEQVNCGGRQSNKGTGEQVRRVDKGKS